MSEERFKFIKGGAIDTVNDKEYVEEEVVRLINFLISENDELEQENGRLRSKMELLKLENKKFAEIIIESGILK